MISLSENKINSRRNWKAETFPYDYFFPDETKECQYCLTDKQAELIRGILQPAGWLTRWWSESDTTIDREIIETFRDDMIRRLMMPCCNDDVIYTYDEDGNLESSEDGGTVFTPDPDADIRINPKVIFPQPPDVEGVDEKCVAADSAVALIKEQIGDQLTDDMSRYTLGQLISDWTNTIIGTSNPFQALVVIITNQLFALVISAVRAALTTDVYDKLRCALDCNMSDDISFTEAQWADVRNDITTNISGVAGIFLEHLIYLLGSGGITNLARSSAGSATADCSECECNEFCGTNWIIVDDRQDNPVKNVEDKTISGDATLIAGNYYWAIMIEYPNCCAMEVTITGAGSFAKFFAPCSYSGSLTLDEGTGWVSEGLNLTGNYRGVLIRSSTAFSASAHFDT